MEWVETRFPNTTVIAGLDPAIQIPFGTTALNLDHRGKPGDDGGRYVYADASASSDSGTIWPPSTMMLWPVI